MSEAINDSECGPLMQNWGSTLSFARMDPIMLSGAAVSIGKWA